MLDSLVCSCVACDTNTDDILRLFFIDTCVCLTFNKIRPTRVHKHRWVETDRVDHHHHACLFSRFGARVRFHRDTSGSDKFFSLTTLTFDATGEKFLTLACNIFFFLPPDYRVTTLVAIVENARAILRSWTPSAVQIIS